MSLNDLIDRLQNGTPAPVTHTRVVSLYSRDVPDENTVLIMRPTKWGNPFAAEFGTIAERITAFREYLRGHPDLVAAARSELRGKVLLCVCKPQPCHGDVLAAVADGEEP